MSSEQAVDVFLVLDFLPLVVFSLLYEPFPPQHPATVARPRHLLTLLPYQWLVLRRPSSCAAGFKLGPSKPDTNPNIWMSCQGTLTVNSTHERHLFVLSYRLPLWSELWKARLTKANPALKPAEETSRTKWYGRSVNKWRGLATVAGCWGGKGS